MNTFEFRNNGPLPKGRWMPFDDATILSCVKCGKSLFIKEGTAFADDGSVMVGCPGCGFKDAVQLVGHPSAVPRPKVQEVEKVEAV